MSLASLDGMNTAGESLCLEFANTARSENNHIGDYDDLVSWCEDAGVLGEERASRLHGDALQHPERAAHVFRKAIALRQAVYGVFSAAATRRAPREGDLRSLNKAVVEASVHLRIVWTANDFQWHWDDTRASLEFPLWLLARSAADLLTSERQSRVRHCESAECGWLFVDRSKNRSRRWCDMTECGNREKARRSRARKQSDMCLRPGSERRGQLEGIGTS